VLTPHAKRQEILTAYDGSGVSAARFAAMAGINYSTFSSWVQERNQKLGKEFALTGAAAKSGGAMDRDGDFLQVGAALRWRDRKTGDPINRERDCSPL
jgi:hypothetical protein